MRNLIKFFVNLLTTLRFLSILVLIIIFKKTSHRLFIITISLLFLTDFIDGKLARKYKVQTIYGSNMDTIADKALSIGLIILLLKKNKYIYLVLLGEIIISIINTLAKLQHKKTKSSLIGKIKTWFLSITIILSYINYFKLLKTIYVLPYIIITSLTQIYCIVDYIIYLIKQKPAPTREIKSNKNILYKLFSTEYYLKTIE